MASEYVILALLVSVSAATEVRLAARMKPESKLSEGMLSAYDLKNLRIVAAMALSFSESMAEFDACGGRGRSTSRIGGEYISMVRRI